MPLVKGAAGKTSKGIGQNIKAELKAGRPKAQAVAIAMRVAGKPRPKPK